MLWLIINRFGINTKLMKWNKEKITDILMMVVLAACVALLAIIF
jgi:hypothetical protein